MNPDKVDFILRTSVYNFCELQVSTAFEFGGTSEKPRTRDNWWFRAIASDVEPHKGLVIKVKRRPRTRRGEEPHPTLRIMQANPNGMLYVLSIAYLLIAGIFVCNRYLIVSPVSFFFFVEQICESQSRRNSCGDIRRLCQSPYLAGSRRA